MKSAPENAGGSECREGQLGGGAFEPRVPRSMSGGSIGPLATYPQVCVRATGLASEMRTTAFAVSGDGRVRQPSVVSLPPLSLSKEQFCDCLLTLKTTV